LPERLRRLEYTFQRLPIYFVTACTHERRPILNNADIHTRFIEFGKEGADHGAWLGAYVYNAGSPARVRCNRRSANHAFYVDEISEEHDLKSASWEWHPAPTLAERVF